MNIHAVGAVIAFGIIALVCFTVSYFTAKHNKYVCIVSLIIALVFSYLAYKSVGLLL